MPRRDLELDIYRKGRHEDTLAVFADPDSKRELRDALVSWLEGHKWSPGRWGEFEAEVRAAGRGKVLATVRA